VTLWRYTLRYNPWLNRCGVGVYWAPRGEASVYDFSIWNGERCVAGWPGTESDAFNAMLWFEARDRDPVVRIPDWSDRLTAPPQG
jgi:hypothetical protein